MSLTIRAGSFFRTRDGRKARIYATDGNGPYSVHGSIDGYVEHWSAEGLRAFPVDADTDLVAEWTEPRPRLKAWRYKIGGSGPIHLGTTALVTVDDPELMRGWERVPHLDEPEEGK